MDEMTFLEQFKNDLDNAAKQNADIMRSILSVAADNMLEIDVTKETNIDYLINLFYKVWNEVEIPTFERDQSNGTKKIVPFFKRPQIPNSIIEKITRNKRLLEEKKEVLQSQKEIEEFFYNKKPITKEVTKHLYNILFCEKVEKTSQNIKNVIDWITHLDKANKILLYRTMDADGSSVGGNGKSTIIQRIAEAADELKLTSSFASLPGWWDTEISKDYAENIFTICEEINPNLRRDPGYSILDKNNYNIKEKYVSQRSYKSITNAIGTTNESMENLPQTTLRRIGLVECNENFDAKKYIRDGGALPSQKEIKDSWVYLLTHDLTSISVKDNCSKSISQDMKKILWDIQDNCIISDTMFLGDIKDALGDKVNYGKLYNAIVAFGAIKVKNGNHGERLDKAVTMDMSNFKVPDEVWGSITQNLDEVQKAIEESIILPNNLPDDPVPTNDKEDDIDSILAETNMFDDSSNTEINNIETYNYIEPNLFAYKDEFSSAESIEDGKTDSYQFETINPIKATTFAEEMEIPREEATPDQLVLHSKARKDENVYSMRNFLFECDDSSLEEQQSRICFLAEKNVINRVVFSGNKSYHCRITINEEPESIEHYKWLWNKLNDKYFSIAADKACSNPARLTRKPNGVRTLKDGRKVVQKLCYNSKNIIDVSNIKEEWENYKKMKSFEDQMIQKTYQKPTPKSNNILEELYRVEDKYGDRETYQKALALAQNDGTLSYQEAASATCFIMSLGFTAEDCLEQIEYGKWNFKKSYLESLENFV